MISLCPRSIETLIDLVEIKLSCIEGRDRDDRDERKVLQRALAELQPANTALREVRQPEMRRAGLR